MSKRWRIRLIAYSLLAAALGIGAWQLWRNASPRDEPDVIFTPTPPEAIDKMFELAAVTRDDVVYDLGCGDARILIEAAKRYGCRTVGWELRKEKVEESRRNAQAAGVGHLVHIHEGNIFDADLSECTVLCIYLLPTVNTKLIPQMEKMRPGSRIVSYKFDMPGTRPKKVAQFRNEMGIDRTVYLWTIPLERE